MQVPTENNPADVLSKDMTTEELRDEAVWSTIVSGVFRYLEESVKAAVGRRTDAREKGGGISW